MNYVDSARPTLISICRGVGMLDEAVKLVLPDLRILCSAEWETYANAVVLARMEEQTLEPHPVWFGDIAGLKLGAFHGLVDILCAGMPCQPYSLVGNQNGNTDARSWGSGGGPIPQTLRLIGECRPAVVFFENVPAWVRSDERFFRPVGDELCRMGYTLLEPVFVSASDTGASHLRERVFVMAYAQEPFQRGRLRQARTIFDGGEFTQCGGPLGEPASGGFGMLREPSGDQGRGQPDRTDPDVANADQPGLEGHSGHEPDRREPRRHGTREKRPAAAASAYFFAPGPDSDLWERTVRSQNPQLWPKLEPGFRVLVDGLALVVDENRSNQLRCAGNGVVALQGAVAFAELFQRLKNDQLETSHKGISLPDLQKT
jgi:DNA (cytosine-5)-methyltransferase 1